MKDLNNRNSDKRFIVYARSYTNMLVGEESIELNGGYVILEEFIEAFNEFEAKEKVSSKYDINIDELIAQQIVL